MTRQVYKTVKNNYAQKGWLSLQVFRILLFGEIERLYVSLRLTQATVDLIILPKSL